MHLHPIATQSQQLFPRFRQGLKANDPSLWKPLESKERELAPRRPDVKDGADAGCERDLGMLDGCCDSMAQTSPQRRLARDPRSLASPQPDKLSGPVYSLSRSQERDGALLVSGSGRRARRLSVPRVYAATLRRQRRAGYDSAMLLVKVCSPAAS